MIGPSARAGRGDVALTKPRKKDDALDWTRCLDDAVRVRCDIPSGVGAKTRREVVFLALALRGGRHAMRDFVDVPRKRDSR